MKEITIKLRIISPVFLGGINPDEDPPELRGPAFRGVMRYWFRAIAGAVIGDNNLSGLKRLESAVFGDTETGSPLKIFPLQKDIKWNKEKINPHWEGLAAQRNAFKENQENAEVVLKLSSNYTVSDVIWNAALSSLELAMTFGGIGLRSRRGFGTLSIVSSNSNCGLDVRNMPVPYDQWIDYIQSITKSAVERIKLLATQEGIALDALPAGETNYPCASKNGSIWITEPYFESSVDAICGFMEQLKGNVPQNTFLGGCDGENRQASPLWVRALKMDNDEFGLLISVLDSKFTNRDYLGLKAFIVDKILEEFDGKEISVEGWNE